MMSLLRNYLTLLELSRQMLNFAQRQEWDSLVNTEAQRAALLAATPAGASTLAPAERAALGETIQQILACDREVLEYVTPWREDVAKLLTRLALPH